MLCSYIQYKCQIFCTYTVMCSGVFWVGHCSIMNSHRGGPVVVQVYMLQASKLGLCRKQQQKVDSTWKCGRDDWSNFPNN
jgi:hypothetical protein